ncbi:MAG: glycosyltransferase [Actinomycetota bacterium]|nr:glycosyltransferase [Actinomycetota bacterium]
MVASALTARTLRPHLMQGAPAQPTHPHTWDGLVVIFGGAPWDGPRLAGRHVAERLAAHTPVLYVDPPLSHLTPRLYPHVGASLKGPRLRLLGPSLARLIPLVQPGSHRPGMRALGRAHVRRALRGAVEQLGARVRTVVVIGQRGLLGVCNEEQRVLYATDDFAAGAGLMGVSARYLRHVEERLLRRATHVVVCSPWLAEKFRARGMDPIFVPNGVDAELFAATDSAPLPDDVDLPRPIVGFVGHLSNRIDLGMLDAVAERGHSLLLVGPRQRTFHLQRLTALLERPNVRWVGHKPFEQLPSYLRIVDVGLVPYSDSPFNRASFPLKTLEYLAAGRAAVATDLPAVRWLGTDLVRVASDPARFADEVDKALEEGSGATQVALRREFAAGHGWDRRAAAFAEALGIPTARVASSRPLP